jgi:hypothetical protein
VFIVLRSKLVSFFVYAYQFPSSAKLCSCMPLQEELDKRQDAEDIELQQQMENFDGDLGGEWPEEGDYEGRPYPNSASMCLHVPLICVSARGSVVFHHARTCTISLTLFPSQYWRRACLSYCTRRNAHTVRTYTVVWMVSANWT